MAENKSNKSSNLSPIGVLISNSWKTFRKSLLPLFVLFLIGIGLNITVIIVSFLLALPLGGLALFQIIGQKSPDFASILPSIGGLVIVFIVFIVALSVTGYILQISSILIVDNPDERHNYGTLLRKSLSLVIPLFLTSTLMFLIVSGSFFVFIIPAIIFYLAFLFVPYEVVLNNQKYGSALRRSMKMVFSNFWPLLLRFLVLIGLYALVSFAPSYIMGLASRDLQAFYGFFSFFINIALGWFALCYSINLYKEARKGFENDKGSRLLWPVIISIIGWVMSIFVMISITALIATLAKDMGKNKFTPPANQKFKGLPVVSPSIIEEQTELRID